MCICATQHPSQGGFSSSDAAPSAEIIDLARARPKYADRAASARIDAAYVKRIRGRAGAIRRYAAAPPAPMPP
jgi:hypothetical protein